MEIKISFFRLFSNVDGCHHTKYTIAASPRELQTTLNTMLTRRSFEALHSSVMADFNSPAPTRSQPAASSQQPTAVTTKVGKLEKKVSVSEAQRAGGRCLFNIFRLQKHISKHWMDPFSEEEFGLHTGADKNSFELENNKKFWFHIRCI